MKRKAAQLDSSCILPVRGAPEGVRCILDKEDFDWASSWEWAWEFGNIYRGDPEDFDHEDILRYALAHRIYGEEYDEDDMCLDHIDGNKLNYRRANLRLAPIKVLKAPQKPGLPVEGGSASFEQPDSLRVLPLKEDQAVWCILDKQDWDWAKHYQWRKIGKHAHRLKAPQGESKLLHREIARRMSGKKEADGMHIEHIDGNTFNCRRINIRLATSPNEKKDSVRCSPGVCWWVKPKKQWVACVGHKYLRYFNTLDEALEAQKKAQQEDEDEDAVIAEPLMYVT